MFFECKLEDFFHKSRHETSLLYFYPIYTCWSKGMKRESFSKRFWGKYDPAKVWAKFMKNTMPRTSVSNEFKVGVQTGKPPLRSHGDKWYFHSAIRRSWREGNPHSKVILTGEGSNASLNSWNNKKMATCPKSLPHLHPHEIGDSQCLENEMLHSITVPMSDYHRRLQNFWTRVCSAIFMWSVNVEQKNVKGGKGQVSQKPLLAGFHLGQS